MKKLRLWLRRILYGILALIALIAIAKIIADIATKPSNDRDWSADQAVLPYAVLHDNVVVIHNIRNFTYASTTSYTPAYYDRVYDLNKLKKVWYIVEPFSGFVGSAHTFLSFEFEGDVFVSISIEIRKEKGETFSAIKGFFDKYELMYIAADERDVIKLRSNYRKDLVYVYPVRTTEEKARELFVSMAKRMNDLKDHPEFYNSLTDNCTTNIADHVNIITPHKIPFLSLGILFPSYSDKLAYNLGLIDTDLPFDKARERYLINDKALKYANDPDFSRKIRE